MRAAVVLLLLATLMTGCASQVSSIDRSGERAGEATLGGPAPHERAPPDLVSLPADDPRAPPLTLAGAPTHAAVILARERVEGGWRELCGGAVLAVPEGVSDPRHRMTAWTYVESYRLVDDAGREWITDRYRDEVWSIWIARVGGGTEFLPDDGESRCEPAGPEHNVLLHARGVERVSVVLETSRAPPTPDVRVWWMP